MVTGGVDGTLRLRDPGTGRQLRPPVAASPITGYNATVLRRLVADGAHVVVYCDDEYHDQPAPAPAPAPVRVRVWVWDPAAGRMLVEPLTGHTAAGPDPDPEEVLVARLTDGDSRAVLVTAGLDGTLRRWDLPSFVDHAGS